MGIPLDISIAITENSILTRSESGRKLLTDVPANDALFQTNLITDFLIEAIKAEYERNK